MSLFTDGDLKILEALRKFEANNWAITFSRDDVPRVRRLAEIALELSVKATAGAQSDTEQSKEQR